MELFDKLQNLIVTSPVLIHQNGLYHPHTAIHKYGSMVVISGQINKGIVLSQTQPSTEIFKVPENLRPKSQLPFMATTGKSETIEYRAFKFILHSDGVALSNSGDFTTQDYLTFLCVYFI